MVGGGSHWSFNRGMQRPYKPQQLLERKRIHRTSDEQSQQLQITFACANIFRGAQRAARRPTRTLETASVEPKCKGLGGLSVESTTAA